MISSIKLTLVVLFFVCLLKMPYGYYELVRFAALIGFAFLAYDASRSGNTLATVTYAALALLFQPFFKVALGRELWNIVDVIVAAGLLLSLFIKKLSK